MIAGSGQGGRLTARRDVLGMAGALAVATLAPGRVLAQRYSASTISQAAQDARRDVGRFVRRADELLRKTVADGADRNAIAVRRFRAEQVGLSRELAEIFNSRVSEDDWLLIVPLAELDLALEMRPLVIRLAPTAAEVETAVSRPLPQVEPLAGDAASDVLLAIILASLGVPRRVALFEQMRNDLALGPALRAAGEACKGRRYGLAAMELQRTMRAFVQPAIVRGIADEFGPEARLTLYQSLVVRFVPFLGWDFFVSLLLATIYYNGDTSAPVLR